MGYYLAGMSLLQTLGPIRLAVAIGMWAVILAMLAVGQWAGALGAGLVLVMWTARLWARHRFISGQAG
jgi:hypothetical protein